MSSITESNQSETGEVLNKKPDLMTKEGVAAYMGSSRSPKEWDDRYDEIKKMYGGYLPDFWPRLIEASGLAQTTIGSWKK
ncbi:TPA: hypothetical protein DIU27_00825 [Candidatus Collierbacteria bacterium]|nr:hypothetical protein [Candidatus Collierbacteria bacterium]